MGIEVSKKEEVKMADGAKIIDEKSAFDEVIDEQMVIVTTQTNQVSVPAKKKKRRKVALPSIAE